MKDKFDKFYTKLLCSGSIIVGDIHMADISGEATIHVRNPKNVGGAMNSYVTYTISWNSATKTYVTERRYSEFAWLREKLLENYKGCIIPHLPGE